MPNGDTHTNAEIWQAIERIRDRQAAAETRTAVNESQVLDLKDDINGIGQKVDQSETRIKKYVDGAVGGMNEKFDRGVTWLRWVAGISVPLVAGLAGALITRAG